SDRSSHNPKDRSRPGSVFTLGYRPRLASMNGLEISDSVLLDRLSVFDNSSHALECDGDSYIGDVICTTPAVTPFSPSFPTLLFNSLWVMSVELNPRLQSVMDGLETRMVERQEAIEQRNGEDEQVTDQKIVKDLRDTASALPSESLGPEAKQKFEAIATEYEKCESRSEHNQLIHKMITILKHRNEIAQLLKVAASLSIMAIAPTATMDVDVDGDGDQDVHGYSIDNDDGAHKFLYDADGNGILDHEVVVDDETNEQIGDSESLDLREIGHDLLEFVTNILS
ncbi:hypothetical protein FRC11_003906, partial [Ceratobasidium sp. 423]